MQRIRVFDAIRSIEPGAWNDLLGPYDSADYGWLCTVEESFRTPLRPHYVALEEDGRLLGAACCAVMEHAEEVLGVNQALLGRAAGLCSTLGVSFLPALVCSPFKVSGPHVGVGRGLKGAERREVLSAIVNAVEREAEALKLPVIFQNVDKVLEAHLAGILAERGYAETIGPPACSMRVCWNSFDGYLSYLRGRSGPKGPQNVKRELRRSADAGVRVEVITQWELYEKEIYRLLDDH